MLISLLRWVFEVLLWPIRKLTGYDFQCSCNDTRWSWIWLLKYENLTYELVYHLHEKWPVLEIPGDTTRVLKMQELCRARDTPKTPLQHSLSPHIASLKCQRKDRMLLTTGGKDAY